tara:strand:+ start:172 stop:363 length:192 start_codon:yes stop_codon:yes gene_type:complete
MTTSKKKIERIQDFWMFIGGEIIQMLSSLLIRYGVYIFPMSFKMVAKEIKLLLLTRHNSKYFF